MDSQPAPRSRGIGVNVTEKAVKAITAIGHARDPHEACGLLLTQPGEYEPLVIEIPNGSKNPETSYEFSTAEARKIIDELVPADYSFDDVVVWHTHPARTAGPSEADLRSRDARIKYLVVFLPTGQAFRY